MKHVDPERAAYTARRVELALLHGAYTEAKRILEDDIKLYEEELDIREMKDYVYAAEVPMALSTVIKPETLEFLDEAGYIRLGQVKFLSREELSKIPGLGKGRIENAIKACEELFARWKKAKAAQTKKKDRDYVATSIRRSRTLERELENNIKQSVKEEIHHKTKMVKMMEKTIPKAQRKPKGNAGV